MAQDPFPGRGPDGRGPDGDEPDGSLDAEDGGTRLILRHDDLPNPELHDGHHVAWETYPPARHPSRGR